ncbi:MAG: glycosyltransferase family A protein [Polyangiales bacterium]
MSSLLSVIVPNYNYATYLRACLDSAIALRYEPKEIIVVDDGSTDNSREIIREYEAAGKISAIYKENGGQPDAVNLGFERARGEMIYILDSDDVVFPHMLEQVLPLWTARTSKIQFSLESIDQHGQLLGSVFPNYHTPRSPAELRRSVITTGEYQSPPTSGNLYARSYLQHVLPVDRARFRFSDGPLNAVAPLYGDVASFATPLGQYRMHTQNQWGRATFNPRSYTTALRHNIALDTFVIEHARELGIAIDAKLGDHAPWALQYRMASVCLNPNEHPTDETPRDVARLGVTAVTLSGSLTLAQKAVMIAWFTGMAVAPARLQEELTKLRFLPSYRPAFLGKTLRFVGALKRPASHPS